MNRVDWHKPENHHAGTLAEQPRRTEYATVPRLPRRPFPGDEVYSWPCATLGIDRLWNRFVAAWFEGGRTDPNLQLLRFEPGRAQLWLNDHSLLAGMKLLLGRDPKDSYKDKTADVRFS